ncbi:MAG TPA: phosphotransferase [Chitinophagaceae bacterium]|nr:phosphotransferase [Chitinophagaceae bacterium]
MNDKNYREAILVFGNYHPDLPIATQDENEFVVELLTGGLINQTFKVSSPLASPFLLQQINHHVFTKPEEVQQNYIYIWEYAEFEFTGLHLPAPIYFNKTKSLFIDTKGNYWRAFEFIDDARMLTLAEKPAQAKATAKAFAKFTSAFDEFNVDLLKPVIPGFHNLSFRYLQFEEAVNGEFYERMPKSLPLIEELKKRERYKDFYEFVLESPDEFPKRVMHHDAKIANALFSKKSGKVICLVDFDTVMPGYFFSDSGDMIRSMACSVDESSTDFKNIAVRKDFYLAITEGYLSAMKEQFTAAEKKNIHSVGLLMIYMQALRYLTDYLNGDVYYRVNYAEQNFDRAKNQLILLQKLELYLEKEFHFKV